jgi:lysylphosphatidylglycerol synthetase-like protein (DUF2156 family)
MGGLPPSVVCAQGFKREPGFAVPEPMSASPSGTPATARPFHRPILVAILAVLLILAGVLLVIGGILLAIGAGLLGGLVFGTGGFLVGAALGAAVVVAGALMLIAGFGMWGMQSWAWWLAMIVLVLELVGGWSTHGTYAKVALGFMIVYLIVVKKHFNQ